MGCLSIRAILPLLRRTSASLRFISFNLSLPCFVHGSDRSSDHLTGALIIALTPVSYTKHWASWAGQKELYVHYHSDKAPGEPVFDYALLFTFPFTLTSSYLKR